MIYGSVCSGIEAVSCGWHPLGLRPAWFAEKAPFPSAVLAHRWPEVHNYGDFTRIGVDDAAPAVDVLVGGTPCQSFSVAGGRAGLDDPRGHLAVEFLRLASRLGARWVVWENVPGVFSVDDGAAFRSFVELLVQLGYGVAWRVLDAQHFGVPQRRRRVFVVGYLGDWRPPVAVLFERPSVRRDPRTRGSAGTSVAVAAGGGAAGGIARTMTAHHGRNSPEDMYALEPARCVTARSGRDGASSDQTFALSALPIQNTRSPRGGEQNGMGVGDVGDPMFTLTTRSDHAVFAFDSLQVTSMENRAIVEPGRPSPTITRMSKVAVAGPLRPRRLTPREVERLFGFADDYTAIPVGKRRKKPAKDAPRYHALGNSMAVPVLAWIGRRLKAVDELVGRRDSLAGEAR